MGQKEAPWEPQSLECRKAWERCGQVPHPFPGRGVVGGPHRKQQPPSGGWPVVTHGNQLAFRTHPSSAGDAFSDLQVVLRIPLKTPWWASLWTPPTHTQFMWLVLNAYFRQIHL